MLLKTTNHYNIALGFILFNPPEESINRIINTASLGYEIFVVLNSKINEVLLKGLNSNESIHIINTNSNEGLSRGLQSICHAAHIIDYKAILYFDQDSVFTHETLDYVRNYFDYTRENSNEFIHSIICTTFRDTTNLSKRYNHISSYQVSDFLIENVFFTINSGSLYFLEKINDFEWFDKEYFIDGVDYSFCINSIKNKLKITEIYNTPGLDHETEQGNISIKIFNKQKLGRVYSLDRNIDFLKSHLKILMRTFSIKNLKPKIFILKTIFVYLFFQIVLRLKNAYMLTILHKR